MFFGGFDFTCGGPAVGQSRPEVGAEGELPRLVVNLDRQLVGRGHHQALGSHAAAGAEDETTKNNYFIFFRFYK